MQNQLKEYNEKYCKHCELVLVLEPKYTKKRYRCSHYKCDRKFWIESKSNHFVVGCNFLDTPNG